MKTKRKQISINVINDLKHSINKILSSNASQTTKEELCKVIENINNDLKIKSEYKYLYWEKYGNLDWEAEKHIHFSKMKIGDNISVPSRYIIGEAEDNDNNICGEYSRKYL